MLNALRHWHWTLLHRVFGLPDRNHGEPHASLPAILHSHPAVPAHHHHFALKSGQTLRAQINRERQRHPRIMKSWQRAIGATFERQLAKRCPQ